MKSISERIKDKPWLGWVIFFVTVIVVFLLGLLASSIIERRTEAQFVYTPKVKYEDWEPRSELWGKNFPREYETWLQTADTTFRSKYNGSATIDMLSVDPRLVILWAGYGFSKDYNQSRGHIHAVNDIQMTLRTGAPTNSPSPMVNTCWTCKSPDVPRVMNMIGVADFYKGTWELKGKEIMNPIGCADCHDAKTMELKITRSALIEAFKRRGIDITKATHQEMRTLVCAQCHVEYYFDKHKVENVPYLTFPWDKGFSVDSIEKYYDELNFSDWTHSLSKTPMIKAQHPGYELFMTGIHYQNGVACADCHMPYKTEGGQKFSDHHIQSPLNNITNSCQVCHRDSAAEMVRRVYSRQDKIIESRDILEKILVRAHIEAKKAWDLGATEEQMKPVLTLIRHSQWRWDFAAASHGNSFHSPLETSRIIASGIEKGEEARIILARLLYKLGITDELPYPDISSKEKAQKYIGLDMAKLYKEKEDFVKSILPVWYKEGTKREATYKVSIL